MRETGFAFGNVVPSLQNKILNTNANKTSLQLLWWKNMALKI